MFILLLKLILALVLTMIPFVFHYWIKPKSNESPKWKNSISILEENLPSIRRKKRIIFLWFMRFYKKMKFSRNARKFFTYILIVSMLIVQFVDFQASKYAKEHLNEVTSISVENTQPRNSTCLASKHKTSAMLLRSHTTPFWAFNLCLIITLATFSFRLSDIVLTKIHNVRWIKWAMGIAIVLLIVTSIGRLLLVAEISYLILMAGLLYPNPRFDEYGKWRRRITNQVRRKSVIVSPGEKQRKSA
ncbi:MAG: hypothetical protein UFD09_08110 [Prevotella sp.]|nr:hypothetical protein [Prevotella sp.]